MKHLNLFFLSVLITLGLLGCTKTPDVNTSTLQVSQQDIEVSGSAQTITFDIQTSRNWTIELQASASGWVSIPEEELSGSGNATIHVTVERNLNSMRFGKINVKPDNAKKVVVTIEQNTIDRTTLYSNRFQGTALTSATSFAAYWSASEGVVSGDGTYYSITSVSAPDDASSVYVMGDEANGTYSMYPFASGGNYLVLKGSSTSLQVADIITESATTMMLTFGCKLDGDQAFDPERLQVLAYYDNNPNAVPITYTRKSEAGWDMAVADFEVSDVARMKLVFEAPSGDCFLDDINLYAQEGCEIVYVPQVTTMDAEPGNISFNRAEITSTYNYPPYPPVIRERGIAWRTKDAGPDGELTLSVSPFEGDAQAGEFVTTVRPLRKLTTYVYKAYVKDDLGAYYYGEEKEFTTIDFTIPERLSVFRDDFASITENGVLYIDNGWEAGSPELALEDNWHTVKASTFEYAQLPSIMIEPTKEVTAFQILPALDVSKATEKLLYVNYARTLSAGTAKLELVAATDYQGEDYSQTAWQVIADLSVEPGESVHWDFRKIDLSALSGNDYVVLAFRYTGSGAGYHLGLVNFGSEEPVQYGTLAYEGVMKQGTANNNVRVRLPYKYALGEANDVTVATNDAGLTVSPVTTHYTSGDGDFYNSLEFAIEGTPTNQSTVIFTVTTPSGDIKKTVNIYSSAGVMILYNAPLVQTAPGVGTCQINFPSGLKLTRIYKPTQANGNPLPAAQIPNFKFSSGAGNQYQTGPVWNPIDPDNPEEYVLITAPWLQAEASGGRIVLNTTLRAWNVAWTSGGRSYDFKIMYTTSADPTNWKEADEGGVIHISKSGNQVDKNLPVEVVVSLADKTIKQNEEIYFRLSLVQNVITGNISFAGPIKVSHYEE